MMISHEVLPAVTKLEGYPKTKFEIVPLAGRFVADAIEAGAHLTLPKVSKITEASWDRMVNITVINYFGRDSGGEESALDRTFSQDEIGQIFPSGNGPVTREDIRQLVFKTIKYLHNNSTGELQKKYPWLELQKGIARPGFLTYKQGISRKALGLILQGATYQDLIDEDIIVSGVRSTLESWIKVPALPENPYLSVIRSLQSLTGQEPAERIQEVLDQVSSSMYTTHMGEFREYLLVITDLCEKAGFHLTRRRGEFQLIIDTLEQAKIPCRPIPSEVKTGPQSGLRRIIVILRNQEKQAYRVLSGDEQLQFLKRK